jgi:hypothetical protein
MRARFTDPQLMACTKIARDQVEPGQEQCQVIGYGMGLTPSTMAYHAIVERNTKTVWLVTAEEYAEDGGPTVNPVDGPVSAVITKKEDR